MNEVERLHEEIRALRVEVSNLRIERDRFLRTLNHEERSQLGYHGPDCAIQRGADCDCETQQYNRALGTANILRRMWQELAEALGTDEEHVAVVARELAAIRSTPSNVGHDGPTRSEPVTPKAQHSSGDVERVVRAALEEMAEAVGRAFDKRDEWAQHIAACPDCQIHEGAGDDVDPCDVGEHISGEQDAARNATFKALTKYRSLRSATPPTAQEPGR